MALTEYQQKRDFKKTPEPKSKTNQRSNKKLIFVVQRHKASRLHYDFRLELEGVLKSWAVPKGPSLNPEDKRLAIKVEDHPYAYKDFSGIIPAGNYGAGIVEIWDFGYYTDLENNADQKKLLADLESGEIKFILHGKKLEGEFVLVKLKSKNDNNWLLIKHRDQYAVQGNYDIEADAPDSSQINQMLKVNPKKKPETL